MIIDGVLFGIIIALLRGGKLSNLATLRIRGAWILIFLWITQMTLYVLQEKIPSLFQKIHVFSMVSYFILFYILFQNKRIPGMNVLLIGGLLNFLVMAVNGGYMPVSAEAASLISPTYIHPLPQGPYGRHILMSDNTHLNFLGDIIPLLPPYPRQHVVSIGDVLINIGAFMAIQGILVGNKEGVSKREKLGMAI